MRTVLADLLPSKLTHTQTKVSRSLHNMKVITGTHSLQTSCYQTAKPELIECNTSAKIFVKVIITFQLQLGESVFTSCLSPDLSMMHAATPPMSG